MTPGQIIEAYGRADQLFDSVRYARKKANAPDIEIEFITEAHIRIQQLHYVIKRFVELDREHDLQDKDMIRLGPLDPGGHQARADAVRSFGPTLELYAEAFYLFAWRLREVLRQISGFHNFDPKGVRQVRNWLIEHADDDGGVMSRSFIFHCPEGLILKPWGGAPERARDQGLYPNAQEFIEQLLLKVEAVAASPSSQ